MRISETESPWENLIAGAGSVEELAQIVVASTGHAGAYRKILQAAQKEMLRLYLVKEGMDAESVERENLLNQAIFKIEESK